MTDAIPTTDAFRPVVLQVLSDGAVLSVQQLVKAVGPDPWKVDTGDLIRKQT